MGYRGLVLTVVFSLLSLIRCGWIPNETRGNDRSERAGNQEQLPWQSDERFRRDPLLKARIVGGDYVDPPSSYPWMVSWLLLHRGLADFIAPKHVPVEIESPENMSQMSLYAFLFREITNSTGISPETLPTVQRSSARVRR